MRYWTYVNNEMKGPFETEQLRGQPGFELTSLVCPEGVADGQTSAWKEASAYPEIAAALAAPAAPPPPRKVVTESPLAMTMRGTLLSDPVIDGRVVEAPVPAVKPTAPRAPAPSPADTDPLGRKLDDISAALSTLALGQAQLLDRLGRIENAVSSMKSLLFPAPPEK